MIGLIITGHGNFASGIFSAIELIFGEQQNIAFVDFADGMSTDELNTKLESAISSLNCDDGIMVFSDLLGGSPFKCSCLLTKKYDNMSVLSGTNLAMIMDIIFLKDTATDVLELEETAISMAKEGITSFNIQSSSNNTTNNQPEEGI